MWLFLNVQSLINFYVIIFTFYLRGMVNTQNTPLVTTLTLTLCVSLHLFIFVAAGSVSAADADERANKLQLAVAAKPAPVCRQSSVHDLDLADHRSSSHLTTDDNCTETASHAAVLLLD